MFPNLNQGRRIVYHGLESIKASIRDQPEQAKEADEIN